MTDKKCSQCGRWKPSESAFPRNKSKPGGFEAECRRCKRDRDNTPAARWARRFRKIFSKYGLTPADYWDLLDKQGGRCAICAEKETKTDEYGEPALLVVDHDHQQGTVRGLLCDACNKALGLFEDDPHVVAGAHFYLNGYRRKPGGGWWLHGGEQ